MEQRILELKARAYDLIAEIEQRRNELQAVNNELGPLIQALAQMREESSSVTESTETAN